MTQKFNCCIIIDCLSDRSDQLNHQILVYDLEELLKSHQIQVVSLKAENPIQFFKLS